MSFQKCPVCNGGGFFFDHSCHVCNGTGIIDEITGCPPAFKKVSGYSTVDTYCEHEWEWVQDNNSTSGGYVQCKKCGYSAGSVTYQVFPNDIALGNKPIQWTIERIYL